MTQNPNAKPYDESDRESIRKYAAKLKRKTLAEVIPEEHVVEGSLYIDGLRTKGKFGQLLEEGYFFIENNNNPEPDFTKVGIELKSSPVKESKNRGLVSKERLVLGIIDYMEVPEKGFSIFTHKNSEIIIVFYLWEKNKPKTNQTILKVVDWIPRGNDLRMIREDWNIIQGFVMRGEADLLSERHTKILAACTKGANRNKKRQQPYNKQPAKQRALSLKQSYMTMVFKEYPEIGKDVPKTVYPSVIKDDWKEDESFNDFILNHFNRFVGKTCSDIEKILGVDISAKTKSYYRNLANRMLGLENGKDAVEFKKSDIVMKTVRIRLSGRPKEDMSFPAFNASELKNQTWDDSDFLSQMDREFLFVVFGFNTTSPDDEDRKSLTFLGAFMWNVPEEDLDNMRKVWLDTRDKIRNNEFGNFIKGSNEQLIHVRTHARDSSDIDEYIGITKQGFWFNKDYLQRIISENMSAELRYRSRQNE